MNFNEIHTAVYVGEETGHRVDLLQMALIESGNNRESSAEVEDQDRRPRENEDQDDDHKHLNDLFGEKESCVSGSSTMSDDYSMIIR